MRLTSLTLHGFKSFGNRTTVEFAPGISAVVGPNGSGKSNIIDALKWASGGGRASEFRAGDKTELIFHGAAGKRSLGYAEVELELKGEGRKVNIFRSLHRDGTGKLRMNGKNARFLDIDEELAGSGLGKSGLAIIGQGEVSGVLMADPAKLLQYVAEVAGVARLSGRREQTEERLGTARTHLERLADLMSELERQIERLAAEAGDAARHTELTRETLQLRYTLARLREETLRSELGALREDRDLLQQELLEGKELLEAARAAVSASREEAAASEKVFREALAQSEARRGDVRVARARVESQQGRLEGATRQLQEVQAELAGLADLTEPQPPEAGDDPEALAQSQYQAQQAAETAVARRAEAEARLESSRAALENLRRAAAERSNRHAAYQSRKETLEAELAALERQLGELEGGPDGEESVADLEARLEALRAEGKGLQESLSALRERLEEAQGEHANLFAEAQARARAAERSRQAFEARRGYAEGPRNALASGLPGIHGSVADLLRVDDRHREALGAALGRRLEYVVVDDAETGQRVLDHVRRSGGFVTVLPLDLVGAREPRVSERILAEPGVVGLAADLVGFEPRYAPIVNQLLGSTLVVESMPAAVAIARKERSRPRMVTLGGDTVESYGAMSGGRRQMNAGVLGAAAELESAEASAAEAAQRAHEAKERLVALQAQAREQIDAETAARERTQRLERQLGRAREAEAGRRELRTHLEGRLERTRSDLAGLQEPGSVGEDSEALQAAQLDLEMCERDLARARAEVEERQQELAEWRQARLLASERQRSYRVALEQYRRDVERRAGLRERSGNLEAETRQARSDLESAREQLAAAEAAVPTDLKDKEAAHAQARETLARAEAELSQLGDTQTSRSEALERINVTLARREAAWEAAAEELTGFPPGVARVEGAERTLRQRLSQATEELEGLGPVNHRAAIELEQESTRLAELKSEAEQAQTAIEELASTLEELDRETTSRLEAGVAELREGFRRHVLELFGDTAEADIEIDREEGRPVGMRIRLQPPGKQTRQLNLLSVGERTMGAMAFLFALMSGSGQQGLPIAVLDEVDAPLDEANIRRYCDFLLRLSERGTQFVLITHQKATFEVADVIWGVTTEQGVSKVFSIARPEAALV